MDANRIIWSLDDDGDPRPRKFCIRRDLNAWTWARYKCRRKLFESVARNPRPPLSACQSRGAELSLNAIQPASESYSMKRALIRGHFYAKKLIERPPPVTPLVESQFNSSFSPRFFEPPNAFEFHLRNRLDQFSECGECLIFNPVSNHFQWINRVGGNG